MKWFKRKPKHRHRAHAISCNQGLVLAGPRTWVNWKCLDCGKRWTTKVVGHWAPEDFD